MLQLNHTALHKLKVHGMSAYPEECCGILLGREENGSRSVCDVIELRNAMSEQRERRFLITDEDYRRVEAFAQDQRAQIIGLYHSHPDHPAEPSQFDLDNALPWLSYVIVAVEAGIPAAVRAWRLRDDRSQFDEEELVILETECVHG
jgi:proteasome lid subunit RPN8/RPN11